MKKDKRRSGMKKLLRLLTLLVGLSIASYGWAPEGEGDGGLLPTEPVVTKALPVDTSGHRDDNTLLTEEQRAALLKNSPTSPVTPGTRDSGIQNSLLLHDGDLPTQGGGDSNLQTPVNGKDPVTKGTLAQVSGVLGGEEFVTINEPSSSVSAETNEQVAIKNALGIPLDQADLIATELERAYPQDVRVGKLRQLLTSIHTELGQATGNKGSAAEFKQVVNSVAMKSLNNALSSCLRNYVDLKVNAVPSSQELNPFRANLLKEVPGAFSESISDPTTQFLRVDEVIRLETDIANVLHDAVKEAALGKLDLVAKVAKQFFDSAYTSREKTACTELLNKIQKLITSYARGEKTYEDYKVEFAELQKPLSEAVSFFTKAVKDEKPSVLLNPEGPMTEPKQPQGSSSKKPLVTPEQQEPLARETKAQGLWKTEQDSLLKEQGVSSDLLQTMLEALGKKNEIVQNYAYAMKRLTDVIAQYKDGIIEQDELTEAITSAKVALAHALVELAHQYAAKAFKGVLKKASGNPMLQDALSAYESFWTGVTETPKEVARLQPFVDAETTLVDAITMQLGTVAKTDMVSSGVLKAVKKLLTMSKQERTSYAVRKYSSPGEPLRYKNFYGEELEAYNKLMESAQNSMGEYVRGELTREQMQEKLESLQKNILDAVTDLVRKLDRRNGTLGFVEGFQIRAQIAKSAKNLTLLKSDPNAVYSLSELAQIADVLPAMERALDLTNKLERKNENLSVSDLRYQRQFEAFVNGAKKLLQQVQQEPMTFARQDVLLQGEAFTQGNALREDIQNLLSGDESAPGYEQYVSYAREYAKNMDALSGITESYRGGIIDFAEFVSKVQALEAELTALRKTVLKQQITSLLDAAVKDYVQGKTTSKQFTTEIARLKKAAGAEKDILTSIKNAVDNADEDREDTLQERKEFLSNLSSHIKFIDQVQNRVLDGQPLPLVGEFSRLAFLSREALAVGGLGKNQQRVQQLNDSIVQLKAFVSLRKQLTDLASELGSTTKASNVQRAQDLINRVRANKHKFEDDPQDKKFNDALQQALLLECDALQPLVDEAILSTLPDRAKTLVAEVSSFVGSLKNEDESTQSL